MKGTKANNPNFVVSYSRFSSDNQSESSIEAQQKTIREYAKEHNLIILKEYIDRAQSATSTDRPAFQQMLQDSKQRDFGQVLVYQLDRFARDKEDHVICKIDLRRNGVKVVSVTEQFDDSPEGKMMEGMIETMSAYYSHDLARKTTRGCKHNAEKGNHNGGTVPYGYRLVPRIDLNGKQLTHSKGHILNDLEINPKEAEAVKLIYKMTIEGHKRFQIISKLTELGFLNKKGNIFSGSHIENILKNEKYTGILTYRYNKKKWGFDPNIDVVRTQKENLQIISKEDFEAVQKINQSRKHRPPTNAEENYLLVGKVTCGCCGGGYTGMRAKRKNVIYTYYKCNQQRTHKSGLINETRCLNNSVQKDKLEDFVKKQVINIVLNEKLIDQVYVLFNNYINEENKDNSLVEMLKNQIKDIDKQLSNITNLIANGNQYESLLIKLAKLEEQKQHLKTNLSKEEIANNDITASRNEIVKIFKKARKILIAGTPDEQRTILHNFVNKIIVNKDSVDVFINLIPMTCSASLDLSMDGSFGFGGEYNIADIEKLDSSLEFTGTNLQEYGEAMEKQKKTDSKSIFPLLSQNNLYGANNHWLPK